MALVFGAVVMLLPGCSKKSDRAELVVINGAEPETLDPAEITGQLEGRIAYTLFEGLVCYDERGEVQPGVAEKWEVSPDGLVYTFHLRRDAQWSNGDPVTSADFMKSWKRTLLPVTASEYAYQLHYVKNAKPFNEGTLTDFSQVGVAAPDAHTFVVTLESPTPFFLDLCAFTTLLPVHLPSVEKHGGEWTKPANLIGNGAYLLTSWRLNDPIRLTKNPRYWNRDAIKMNTIDVIPGARANTALNLYLTGAADVMLDKGLAPTQLLDKLRSRPDFHSAPFLGTYFVRFNTTKKPFDDPRVRRAFALVIDRKVLVEKITRAGEIPALSFVPPGTAGYQSPQGPGTNSEEARRLLAEAGYPGGKGFPSLSYLYKGDSDLDRDLAIELQGMWRKELGVNVALAGQEWKVYLSSMSSLDYDLCRSSWVGDYRDPNTFLDMFIKDGGNNRTGWADPEYDQWIAEAARELDPAKRFAIFQKAEHRLVSEGAPIAPLYYYVGIQFYDATRLGGIGANLLDEHPLKTMYWK